MKHRIVTAAQMKEIERAGNAHGLPYLQMIENAGLAAYTQLRARLPLGGTLLIVCGKGNNGGDGLVWPAPPPKMAGAWSSCWPRATLKHPMP